MRVVVDANVVAAALIRPDGWAARQFRRVDVEFLAPSFLLEELADKEPELARRAGIEVTAWRIRRRALLAVVKLVRGAEVARFFDDPLVQAVARVDAADAPYVATLCATGADLLWTFDRALIVASGGRAVATLP